MPHPFRRRDCLATLGGVAASAWLGGTAHAQGQGGDIVIGQSAHLSGPLAAPLKPVIRGQQLALDEFNRRGGVGGRKVRLITLDDAYDAKRCVENVATLIDQEKVVSLFGLSSAANVGAVLPMLADRKIPLFGVYTGAPNLRAKQHPYFFTTMASYRDEVVQMVKNLATVGRSKIALAYHNNPFGQLMLPVVEEVCKEHGSTLVGKAPLDQTGTESVAVTQTLAATNPHAVIFMAFGPALVPFVKAARANLGVPIYAPSISNSRQLLDALGEESRGLAFTQIMPFPHRATTPLTRDFSVIMDKAKLPVDFDHFFGYLNCRLMLEMIRRAGRGVTAQSLVTTIEALGKVDFGGYTLNFGPNNHHGSTFADLLIVGPGGRYIH
jgi:ABC-type branched-subunit amino acid transport system substrate-binding protein